MDETDLARFTESVLITLMDARDRAGLKIMLSDDMKVMILAATITAVMNARQDTALFRPISIGPGGEIRFGE
jgi:hypothetical protein